VASRTSSATGNVSRRNTASDPYGNPMRFLSTLRRTRGTARC
jgi:hypothetical protein